MSDQSSERTVEQKTNISNKYQQKTISATKSSFQIFRRTHFYSFLNFRNFVECVNLRENCTIYHMIVYFTTDRIFYVGAYDKALFHHLYLVSMSLVRKIPFYAHQIEFYVRQLQEAVRQLIEFAK